MELTDKQKVYLDDVEEPLDVAAWALRMIREGYTSGVIKNGRQMTFRGTATLKAVADYLIDEVAKRA